MKYEEKLLKDTMTDIELLVGKIDLIKHDTSVPMDDCKTEREYSRMLYDLHHRLGTVKIEVYRNFFIGEKRVKILKLEKFVEERLDFIQGKKRTALKVDASAIYKMLEQIYDNYLRLYERICYLNRYMHESERTILGNVGESITLKINEKTGVISSIKVSEGLNFGRFMELLERNWKDISKDNKLQIGEMDNNNIMIKATSGIKPVFKFQEEVIVKDGLIKLSETPIGKSIYVEQDDGSINYISIVENEKNIKTDLKNGEKIKCTYQYLKDVDTYEFKM